MQVKKPSLVLILAVIFFLSSCSLSQSTPTNDQNWLSSAVPATLTALAQQPTVTSTPMPFTPTPTLTATMVPSSLKVVYSKDGGIWIWTEGSQPRQLSTGTVDERPRISDDGNVVIFKRNNELWVVNADGTNLHVVVSDQYLKGRRPSNSTTLMAELYDWMPNTHTFFFTTAADTATPDGVGYYYTMDLFRVDVDSNGLQQVFEKGYGGIPYFSPDGKTIALAQSTIILLANTDGTNLHQGMAFEPIPSGGDVTIFPVLMPLPDSSGFRVIIHMGDIFSPSAKAKLWNIPVKGVASVLSTFSSNWLPQNALSPDGNSFAYLVTSTNGNNYSIKDCLHRLNGAGELCLDQGTYCEFQNWLPDSERFVCADREPQRDAIYYLGIFNSNARSKITAGDFITWLDNDQYLFVTKNNELFLASLDGTQIEVSLGITRGTNYSSSSDVKWSLPFDFSYHN